MLMLALVSATTFAAEDPAVKLRTTIDAALDVIYNDCCADLTDAEQQAEVRKVLESNYDLDVIIRYAAGANWKRMTPAEQVQFVELIKQLVLKAYVKGLNGKSRPGLHFGETKFAGQRAEIPMVVLLDGKGINVVYRLAHRKSGWEIYDIVVEDISVGKNYREQINDHFRRGTAVELIEKLKKLLEKDDLDEKITL